MPIQSAAERAHAIGSGGTWGENGTGELVDPDAATRSSSSRRVLRVAVCGVAGAAVAAAVAVGSSQLWSAARPARQAATGYAAAPSASSTRRQAEPRAAALPQVHRSLVPPHPSGHERKLTTRSRARAHHTVRQTPIESVPNGGAAPIANQPAASGEPVRYQPSPEPAPNPPQTQPSATTSSPGGSQATSTSSPATSSPTGALTCISNCG